MSASPTASATADRVRVVLTQLPEDPDRVEQVREVLARHEVAPDVIERALASVPAVVVTGEEADSARQLLTDLARLGALATLQPVRSQADLSKARRKVRERREQRVRWLGLAVFAAIVVAVYVIVPKPIRITFTPDAGTTYRFEQILTFEHELFLPDGTDAHAGGGMTWELERTVESAGEKVVVVDRFANPDFAIELAGGGAAAYAIELEELLAALEAAEIRRVFSPTRRQLEIRGTEALADALPYPAALLDGALGRFFFADHAPKLGETWLASLSTRDALEFRAESLERRQGRRCLRAPFRTVALPNAEMEFRSYAPGWVYGTAQGIAWFDRSTGILVELTMETEMSWGWSGGRMVVGLDHRLVE